MTRRYTLPVLLLLVGILATAGTAAAHQPPRDLHLVGDHWTAWDPPTSFPEGAQVHIVERGDTLWDLAARFYGDAYLWPQLWEQNSYVLDAHWIYPGDPLVVNVEVQSVSSLDDLSDQDGDGADEAEESDNILSADGAAGPPVLLGTESDIYCTGYIGDLEESYPLEIIGSEYEALVPRLKPNEQTTLKGTFGNTETVKYGLATGDVVYLNGGRAAGLQAGQVYTVLETGGRVRHPASGETYGRFFGYTGRVRVLSVQEETAIAEITDSCLPVLVGSMLKPFEPEPVPLRRLGPMRPINFPTPAERLEGAPVILKSQDDVVALGEDHVVFIDRGDNDGVSPGDLYTVYRLQRPGLPPVVIGEVAVLSVHERSSVAKVVRSRYAMYVGDRLEIK